jgi:hypothetical protein
MVWRGGGPFEKAALPTLSGNFIGEGNWDISIEKHAPEGPGRSESPGRARRREIQFIGKQISVKESDRFFPTPMEEST